MKKTILGAALAGLALFSTGCLGPNRAFNDVHEWNQTVTDSDVVNEVIFLAAHIIPVYQVVYLVDIVVLNTIEYWTGDPLLGGN